MMIVYDLLKITRLKKNDNVYRFCCYIVAP